MTVKCRYSIDRHQYCGLPATGTMVGDVPGCEDHIIIDNAERSLERKYQALRGPSDTVDLAGLCHLARALRFVLIDDVASDGPPPHVFVTKNGEFFRTLPEGESIGSVVTLTWPLVAELSLRDLAYMLYTKGVRVNSA